MVQAAGMQNLLDCFRFYFQIRFDQFWNFSTQMDHLKWWSVMVLAPKIFNWLCASSWNDKVAIFKLFFDNISSNDSKIVKRTTQHFCIPTASNLTNGLKWYPKFMLDSCQKFIMTKQNQFQYFKLGPCWKWTLIKLICPKVKSPNPHFSDSSRTQSIYIPDRLSRIVNPLPGEGQIGHNNLGYAMYTST